MVQARAKILQTVGSIQKEFFPDAKQPYNTKPPNKMFQNHHCFIQDIEVYFTLKHVIKYADIGLIKQVVVYCCILFARNSKT